MGKFGIRDRGEVRATATFEQLDKVRVVNFYRAMLCIPDNSHGPVSVCLSVCLSARHKSVFY